MAVFTWVEDHDASTKTKPRVTRVQFGDGYEQRIREGINNQLSEHSVKFSLLDLTTYNEIINFFESHGGVTAFDWAPHGQATGKYVCDEWTSKFAFKGEISATFRRVMA